MLEHAISPDLVCGEVKGSLIKDLLVLGLIQRELTGTGIQGLQAEALKYPGLTHKDVAALLLAIDEGAILLTGDDRLKQYAGESGVEGHGILWILDRLLNSKLLDRLTAADALEAIITNGSWLPMVECTKRIKKWRGSS